MTDQLAGAWDERRPSPAGVLALLILAGAGGWFGWYAYHGELGRLISATPEIEVDLRARVAPAVIPPPQLADTTPSVVLSLTPSPPTPAPKPAAPNASASGTSLAMLAPTLPSTPPAPNPVKSTSTPAPTPSIGAQSTALVPPAQPLEPVLPPPATAIIPPHTLTIAANAMPVAPAASTAPTGPAPTGPAPTGPAPTSPAPTSLAPTSLAPTSPAPTSPAPTSPAPTSPAPTSPAPINQATGSATATTQPEPFASTSDLLAAIGPPPAPALRQALAPAVGTGGATDLNPAKPTTANSSAVTPQLSVISPFLPQSSVSAPAWQRYARPFDNNDPRPRIAIVITKLGLLHGTTLAAIDQLPADVTLSFSPYAIDLDQWISHARSLGHEVMLDLPMESGQGGSDPGPQGLLTSLSAEENLRRLDWVLGRANGYVGLAGVLGDRFTASPVGLRPVLRDIARHGLMFLDPHQTAASVAPLEATKLRLPRAIADLTVDDTPDRVAIDGQLAELERRARITGFAVGLANGYPVTIERLSEWSRGLPDKNLVLAPVSAIADQQADR